MDDPNDKAFLTENRNRESDVSDDESECENSQKEDNLNDNRPISAIAPKVKLQDEIQVEVSSTPAFQCLEEVFLSLK
jgi:hypothetical protein